MMERWRGRVALVTGASVGIGAAIAKELVRFGMKVVGCARSVEKIQVSSGEKPVKPAIIPGQLPYNIQLVTSLL
uniref:Dehydrogenase/reductase SDR family member 11 n=1 Tax=Kryptolebias marmoratus TaxID=37003 RepID=A0A3Q3GTI3_KRYMA